MNEIFKGIRPLDYVLAGLMTVAGLLLMWENIASTDNNLPHPLSTTTWAMAPAFLLVTLPILWRRRNVVAVVGVTAVTTTAHVLAFGWVTRCGVIIPLAFALAYAVARFAGAGRNHLIGLVGIVATLFVMLVRDSSIDKVASGAAIALPGLALFYGIGVLVQNRVTKTAAPLHERTAA
jgi:CDP-diglyceride synthetase